ncbi:MAG: hypothetical protein ACRCUM_01365 [Mycoplasmoidaceae bacterium]
MRKIIKLSLLGTLLTTSALAITLPIVSCSSSINKNNYYIVDLEHRKKAKEIYGVELWDVVTWAQAQAYLSFSQQTNKEINEDYFNLLVEEITLLNSDWVKIKGKVIVEKIILVEKGRILFDDTNKKNWVMGPKLEIVLKEGANFLFEEQKYIDLTGTYLKELRG